MGDNGIGTEEKRLARREPTTLNVGKVSGGIVPQNIDDLWRLAKLMSLSGMMPKNCNTPEAVAVAVQMGLEIGLAPMQAVQNIAVINGRPSIWGDAALGLVEASGLLEDFAETCLTDKSGKCVGYKCMAKRKGRKTPIEHKFDLDDAKTADLLKKPGPWQQYPKRMYQMRARSWTLRDGFADVLKGLRLAEEQMDIIEAENYSVTPVEADPLAAGRHDMKATKPEPEPEAEQEPDEEIAENQPEDDAPEQGGFDLGSAVNEIAEFSELDANWETFVAECKKLGINPQAFEKAGDGQIEALLNRVIDLKSDKE